jgi:signal transduction histidine kinase
LEQIRNVLLDLSSPTLKQMGLTEGLSEWLENNASRKHGLNAEMRDESGGVELADEVRLLMFRNVCELLTNVIKHSQAQSVVVYISRSGQKLQIVVEDDGVGFDPATVGNFTNHRKSFGLFSISVRMSDLGGALELDSAPGKGCRATLRVPLVPTATGGAE